MRLLSWVLVGGMAMGAAAQRQALSVDPAGPPHRMRLILKDGSYQMVMSYKVVGKRVVYVSAERAGETEEIPAELVDLVATEKWVKAHEAAKDGAPAVAPAPVLDPELAKEEADRAALTPEVASVPPDGSLRLPIEDSVVALDTFHGGPELVPLVQQQSDLNKTTGHGFLKGIVNPRSAAHQVVQLKGEKADVQMHVDKPEIYLRIGGDVDLPTGGPAITVDTHGANNKPAKGPDPAASEYVIVRVDVRQDARIVTSFNAGQLGLKKQEDVIETVKTPLAGGHWMKLVPKENLLIGEYALVEVVAEDQINLGVWDFGVHPTAPENRDLIKPERKRPVVLERRRPE